MTIIFYAFLLVGGCCLSAITQVQNLRQASSFWFLKEKSSGKKMTDVKSYEEVNQQFTRLLARNRMIYGGLRRNLSKSCI